MDPYKILGLDRAASAAEIRAAYRKKAAKYHPDVGGDSWAFQQIRDAYRQLTGDTTRRARKSASPPEPQPEPPPTTPDPPSATPVPVPPIVEIKRPSKPPRRKTRRKRRRISPELIGVIGGSLCAILVGLVFLRWWESINPATATSQTQSQVAASLAREVPRPPANAEPRRRPPREPQPDGPKLPPADPNSRNMPGEGADPPPETEPDGDNAGEGSGISSWYDKTAGTTTLGRVVYLTADKLVLEDDHGLLMEIPLSDLDDAHFAEIGLPVPSSKSKLPSMGNGFKALEKDFVSARSLASFYRAELVKDALADDLMGFFTDRLAELTPEVLNDHVLTGNTWQSRAAVRTKLTQSNQAMHQAIQLLRLAEGNAKSEYFRRAKRILDKEAKRDDPASMRAEFMLATANVFIDRDFKQAERILDRCLTTGRRYLPISGPLDRINLSNALNNAALLRVRRDQLREAELLWREMLELVPTMPPEAAHNIRRVADLIDLSANDPGKSLLQFDPHSRKVFLEWKIEINRDGAAGSIPASAGWLYLPYVLAPDAEQSSRNGNSPILVDRATAVLVAPDIVLMAGGLLAPDPGAWYSVKVYQLGSGEAIDGELIRLDPDAPYTAVRVRGFRGESLPLSVSLPSAGDKVFACGIPLAAVERGPVPVELQTSRLEGFDYGFVLPQALNWGYAGGPVLDRCGNVTGLLDFRFRPALDRDQRCYVCYVHHSTDELRKAVGEFDHLPATTELGSVELADAARNGVMRVDGFVNVGALSQDGVWLFDSTVPASDSGTYRATEDLACIVCDGAGQLACTNNACQAGKVIEKWFQYVPGPLGEPLPVPRRREIACPTCRGTTKVDCAACDGGVQR